ncbi:MAG: M23 family metallopeptidase [Caldilineaceae bacterium]
MSVEPENATEPNDVEPSAPVDESIAEDDSVTQSSSTLHDESEVEETYAEPLPTQRHFLVWLSAGAAVIVMVGALWYRVPFAAQPTPPPTATANATSTAAAQLAVLLATATSANPPTQAPTANEEITPTEVEATLTLSEQMQITALLNSEIPLIDLPSLPEAVNEDALAAVAAEGGKPVIIAALAAKQPLAINSLTLEQFLSKKLRVLPAMGFVPSAAEAANLRKIPPTPTPIPIVLAPGRAWVNFIPPSAAENDHFWVGRPFAPSASVQVAAPTYQFGSTGGGRYRVHHGMDIGDPYGTPVLAAAIGEVIHAGPDDVALIGPYNNFYGNTVVIRLDRKLPVAGGGLDVFLLYGHLSQVSVAVGQHVTPEDVIGMVGMTGIAIGPHLHVEMRVGANNYGQSVNPYLWVRPPDGTGAVAVRLLTADGRTWPTARLSLAQFVNGTAVWGRVIEIYPDNESVNPDPAWGENGAMDAVPAGNYYLFGVINGEKVSTNFVVNAGQTTFVELKTTQ